MLEVSIRERFTRPLVLPFLSSHIDWSYGRTAITSDLFFYYLIFHISAMLFIMLVYHVFLFRRTIRMTHTIVYQKKLTHTIG